MNATNEMMLAARRASGCGEIELLTYLESADITQGWRGAVDWRGELPVGLQRLWPKLGTEAKLTAYLIGEAHARRELISAGYAGN